MAGQVLGQVSRPDSALRHLTRRSRFRVTVRIPSVSLGVVRPPVPFAMQKVVGSRSHHPLFVKAPERGLLLLEDPLASAAET